MLVVGIISNLSQASSLTKSATNEGRCYYLFVVGGGLLKQFSVNIPVTHKTQTTDSQIIANIQ